MPDIARSLPEVQTDREDQPAPGAASHSSLSPGRSFWRGLLAALVVLPLAALFAGGVYNAIPWRMAHDTPMMAYPAWLMDAHGFVPYRDFYDINMPGTYLAYLLTGRLFGFDDWGVRLGDYVFIALIMLFTGTLLRRFGNLPALATALMGGLFILCHGPTEMLQRDYIAFAPVAAALCCAAAGPWRRGALRGFLGGFCFGLAATIKPHITIAGLVMLAYLIAEYARRGEGTRRWLADSVRIAAATAFGLALPIGATLGLLAASGALDEFVEIVFNYLPLYGSMTGDHRTIEGAERTAYLAWKLRQLGGHWPWAVAAVAGLLAVLNQPRLDNRRYRHALLLGGVAVAYAVYPALTGQFWKYHWYPFEFSLTLCAGLAFASWPARTRITREIVPLLLVGVLLLMKLRAGGEFIPLGIEPNNSPKYGNPDAIARFLDEHMEPGDTVQPLDWVRGGVAHGMLMARAELATPYLYYFKFFHHVSSPYIQELRTRYMASLEEAEPRFIVQGLRHFPFVRGRDTTTRFPAMEQYLDDHYVVVKHRPGGFKIWERKTEIQDETAR